MAGPIGVVILNLGGPSDEAGIQGFLRRLLSDPEVLPVPWPVRPLLARRIARKRAPLVAGHYRTIGGSPIEQETRAQANALEKALGKGFAVRHIFRHAPPFADDVIAELATEGVRRLIGLPAYPQFSRSTSGSALADLRRAASRHTLQVHEVRSYPDGPGFIAALADQTGPDRDSGRVVFCAHGLPMQLVNRGDPYPGEVRRTAEALARALGLGDAWSLAYQSRMGKTEWTRPYLTDEITRLGREGVGALTLVPLSFACENLETLYELDIEVAELARQSGITIFKRVPAPGCHPEFIGELARQVRDRVDSAGWGGPDD
jgi:ferrochelatase